MAEDCYLPATMRLATWMKDMDVIGKFAYALGAPTPVFSATIPVYAASLGLGLGEEDVAAVCTVLETMSGTERA
jgi:3-hydroxyisobutyrate dehydrogenase-like beta-hydroxyacid dehydrogenase